MEQDTLTAPVEQGSPPESGSQATETTEQSASQSQPSTTSQVESGVNSPPAPDTTRRKPSDFYREREKSRRLEQNLQEQARKIQELESLIKDSKNPKSPEVSPSKFDKDKFWNDPESILKELIQQHLTPLEQLKQEFQSIKQKEVEAKQTQDMREALEVLFPKKSPDSKETLEERIKNSGEYGDMVREILNDPEYANLSPQKAAKIALLEIKERKPVEVKSPKAIDKKLMGGQAAGNPSGNAKANSSAESMLAELKKLNNEIRERPELRFNTELMQRKAKLDESISRLLKEERK